MKRYLFFLFAITTVANASYDNINSCNFYKYATYIDNVIVTDDGESWEILETANVPSGTRLKVLFNNNGTKYIYDDVIVSYDVLNK